MRPIVLLAAALAWASGGPAAAAGAERLGAHNGPGDVAAMNRFGSWLGRTPAYAVDHVDYRGGWDAIANPTWVLDSWAPWVAAVSGRRLVLGVAMLPESARGQLAAGAAGAFDGHFATLARNMVNRGLGGSVVRLGWEANGNWFPWSAAPDPASWRTFFRRVVQTMRSVSGARFSFDWNAASSASDTNLTFDAFYPGDDVVDIVGLDACDLKWMDNTSSPEVRWDFTLNQFNGLRAHRTFASAHGAPVSFPEWGLYARGQVNGGGGDNPYYVDRMADWFQSSNSAYQAYFDADWGGGTLASFPLAQARYKARFGAAPVATTTTTTTATTTTTTAPTPSTSSSYCWGLPEPYRTQCAIAVWGSG